MPTVGFLWMPCPPQHGRRFLDFADFEGGGDVTANRPSATQATNRASEDAPAAVMVFPPRNHQVAERGTYIILHLNGWFLKCGYPQSSSIFMVFSLNKTIHNGVPPSIETSLKWIFPEIN